MNYEFEMPNALVAVAEFHETFGAPILTEPTIPSPDRAALRLSLLQEELDELKAAINDQDITEVADALCDLQYVLSGAVLEFGLGQKFHALFSEVQRSNMSKACNSPEEAEETLAHYAEKGINAHVKASGEKWNVYRDADQKVLKNIHYSEAQLEPIIKENV